MAEAKATQTETVARKTDAKPPLVISLQPKPRVTWAEDVVDNEHMHKKSSKRCCIFHKQRAYDESESDESDSDFEGDAPAPPKNRSYNPVATYHA